MNEIIITNKSVLPKAESDFLFFNLNSSVYEVIRIIDGVALFLEDHFSRLITSALIGGFEFKMEFTEFRQKIDELVILNEKPTGNVKFVLFEYEKEIQWIFSFIPHKYPDVNDFRKGVATGLLVAERQNPGAKIIQNTVRKHADQIIADNKLYEVLLVNRNRMITEGSRSNVFFVKNSCFYTAPETKVLPGITRKKVMDCLGELGFQVVEIAVLVSEISSFDAGFLTGTSPKVLPVNCIGKNRYSTDNLYVQQLMSKYNTMIENYIHERKR